MILPDFQHPSIVLLYIVFLVMLGCASWKLYARYRGARGGEPELYATLLLVFGFVLQGILYAYEPPVFARVDFTSLLHDLIITIGLVAIALNANRIWPLAAAGIQFVSLFSHSSRALQLSLDPWAYSLLDSVPYGLALACIIVGFVAHFRRYHQYGYDYDWVDWSQTGGLGITRG